VRLSGLFPFLDSVRPGVVRDLIAATPWMVIAAAALYALRA